MTGISYVVSSTDGYSFTLLEGQSYRTIECIIQDLNLEVEGLIIPIPFERRVIDLIYKNYNRLSVGECCNLIRLMEFLGCYEMVEKIGSRLLEMARQRIRVRLAHSVKLIMGVTSSIGTQAAILGLIRPEYVLTPDSEVVVPIEELSKFVTKYATPAFSDCRNRKSIHNVLIDLITHLERMRVDPMLIIKSIQQFCHYYGIEDLFLMILIDNNRARLIETALKNGFFYSVDKSILTQVLNEYNSRMIDIVMSSCRIKWVQLFRCCLNSPNPYPLTRLQFHRLEMNKLITIESPLIETDSCLIDRIQHLLSRPNMPISESFWQILVRELLISCHHREARLVLDSNYQCREWLRSTPLACVSSYVRIMSNSPFFNIEAFQLLVEYCPQVIIHYRSWLKTEPLPSRSDDDLRSNNVNRNLLTIAQHDSNLNNLNSLMSMASEDDGLEVTLATALFTACKRARINTNHLITSIIGCSNYYYALIPLRVLDSIRVWDALNNYPTLIPHGHTSEYVRTLYIHSDYRQRKVFLSTKNQQFRSILLSITVSDCLK